MGNTTLCNSSFGKRIKLLRQKLGLTQREAAQQIGVTATSLSAYEAESQKPSIEVVTNAALAFNVPLEWLAGFGDDDDHNILELKIRTSLEFLRIALATNKITIKSNQEKTTVLADNGTLRDYLDTLCRVQSLYGDDGINGPVVEVLSEHYVKQLAKEFGDK